MCRGGPATGTLLQGPPSPGKLPMGAKDWAGTSGGSLGMTGLQPFMSLGCWALHSGRGGTLTSLAMP